jgi:hypothetical protein
MYKSHTMALLVFEKNEENLKKNLILYLNLRSRLTIASLLGIIFHLVLHCWIPISKTLLLMYNSYPVTLLIFEKNEENLKKNLILYLNLRIPLIIAPLLSTVFY